MIIKLVVMGVSGSGKTSVGAAVSHALSADFIEGDSLHLASSIAKMSAGIPLEDADRWPWLDSIGRSLSERAPAVASCSALKRAYRDRLRMAAGAELRFVYLHLAREELARRMGLRREHFMPASLLDSQLATLEDPSGEPGVLRLAGDQSVDTISAEIIEWVGNERRRNEE